MAAHRPVVLAGGRFKQLPAGDKLDVPAEWDALKAPAIAAGVLTIDLATPAGFRVALNHNVTSLSFANVPAGRVIVFTITWVQDATGGRTVAFPASVKADGGGAPVQPAAGANAVTVQSFYTDDGGVTVWQAPSDSAKLDKADKRVPTAWVVYTVSSGVITIRDSFNVSSVTRSSAGVHQINFINQMVTPHYGYALSGESGGGTLQCVANTGGTQVGSFLIGCYRTESGQNYDPVRVVAIFYGGK